jgi:hypothetical protein
MPKVPIALEIRMGLVRTFGGAGTAPGTVYGPAPIQSMVALPEQPLSRTCGITSTWDAFRQPRTALIDSRSELIVASTAEGS